MLVERLLVVPLRLTIAVSIDRLPGGGLFHSNALLAPVIGTERYSRTLKFDPVGTWRFAFARPLTTRLLAKVMLGARGAQIAGLRRFL